MTLLPSLDEKIGRARADLRMGLPVVISSEAGYTVFCAIETLTLARLDALKNLGALHIALTARRAETLKIPAYDGDLVRLTMHPDSDLKWLKSVADPALDLEAPLKGPFDTIRDNDFLPALTAVTLAKTAHLLPAVCFVSVSESFDGLTDLDVDLMDRLKSSPVLSDVIAARVPTAAAKNSKLHVFRPDIGGEDHFALEVNKPRRDAPVLIRLHSACFTGDVLGSLKCDCGPQLHAAMDHIAAEPNGGVLLYLNQEGRGIGLANKMRAYALQDQGFDTVDANHRLGFEDDERDFRIGATLLRELGISHVKLMTNNPNKIKMMEAQGITVTERVPLIVGHTDENAEYLATKAKRSGHMLP